MRELMDVLSSVHASTPVLAVAKGKHYLANSWKDRHRINKQMRGYG